MGTMSDIPDPDHVAADELRIGALLRAVEAPAPAELKRRIVERNAGRRRQWWQGAPAIGLSLAGAAAGACVALVLLLTSGSPVAPTVLRASLVALERPTAPAPAALVASGTNIRFPDWSRRGWPSTGMRTERIGGRSVTTEYFRTYDGAARLGYAIVSGAPLQWGSRGPTRVVGGEAYGLISWGATRIVTWVQDGHTCILASRNTPSRALLALAIAQERGTTA